MRPNEALALHPSIRVVPIDLYDALRAEPASATVVALGAFPMAPEAAFLNRALNHASNLSISDQSEGLST